MTWPPHRWPQTAGASLTYAFTGRSIGWVAATGPAFGRARVYVDGVLVGTVDLHAATTSWRTVVFAWSWATSGSHTLRIVCAGTAGHAKVGVDALVVLR